MASLCSLCRCGLYWAQPALLVPLFFILGSLVGMAEHSGGAKYRPTVAERNACLADFRRLCQGVERGGGRVRRCLEEHFSDLSALCQGAVAASRPAAD